MVQSLVQIIRASHDCTEGWDIDGKGNGVNGMGQKWAVCSSIAVEGQKIDLLGKVEGPGKVGIGRWWGSGEESQGKGEEVQIGMQSVSTDCRNLVVEIEACNDLSIPWQRP